MAENDTIHNRLDSAEEKIAELERRHHQSRGVTRRGALLGLTGLGLLGTASQPTAAESSLWDDTDSDGLLETDYDDVDVQTVNAQKVNTVTNLAEYDSLQAAIDNTPRSGELYIPQGMYLVSDIGTATVSERITISGSGVGQSDGITIGSILQVDEPLTEPLIRVAPSASSGTQMPIFKDIGVFITAGSAGDDIGTIFEVHDSPHAQFHCAIGITAHDMHMRCGRQGLLSARKLSIPAYPVGRVRRSRLKILAVVTFSVIRLSLALTIPTPNR